MTYRQENKIFDVINNIDFKITFPFLSVNYYRNTKKILRSVWFSTRGSSVKLWI